MLQDGEDYDITFQMEDIHEQPAAAPAQTFPHTSPPTQAARGGVAAGAAVPATAARILGAGQAIPPRSLVAAGPVAAAGRGAAPVGFAAVAAQGAAGDCSSLHSCCAGSEFSVAATRRVKHRSCCMPISYQRFNTDSQTFSFMFSFVFYLL